MWIQFLHRRACAGTVSYRVSSQRHQTRHIPSIATLKLCEACHHVSTCRAHRLLAPGPSRRSPGDIAAGAHSNQPRTSRLLLLLDRLGEGCIPCFIQALMLILQLCSDLVYLSFDQPEGSISFLDELMVML